MNLKSPNIFDKFYSGLMDPYNQKLEELIIDSVNEYYDWNWTKQELLDHSNYVFNACEIIYRPNCTEFKIEGNLQFVITKPEFKRKEIDQGYEITLQFNFQTYFGDKQND